MGVEEVMKFVVEKLKEALIAMVNFGGDAFAWLINRIFPPETRADKIHHWLHVAQPFLIAAVIFFVILCLCGCGGGGRKMKAPAGRNYQMPRRAFERNPRGYFRDLRA